MIELLLGVQHNLVALMGEVACAEADAGRYLASKLAKIGAVDVQRLDAALAVLTEQVGTQGARLDSLETRLDGVDARLDTQDRKLDLILGALGISSN